MRETKPTKSFPFGRLGLFLPAIAFLLTGCGGDRPAADTVIANARVYTVSAARPWAEAVAVKDGRILAVGSAKEIARHKSKATRIIDAGGRLVLPGLMDSHVHFVSGSLNLSRADLAGARTVEEIQGRILTFAREHPEAAWVQGRGWMYPAFPGHMPHKKQLDEVVPDRPAVMRCADGHSSWVNSRALALAGIDRETKDPENGRIVRDESGEPTGALLEAAAHLVSAHIPEPTPEETLAALRQGMRETARLGVVRAHGMGGEFEALDLFDRLRREGSLTTRLSISMWIDAPGPTDKDWKAYEDARAKYDDEWLSLGGIKLMLDGVIDSGTGAMLDPYEEQRGNKGKLFWEPEDYKKAVAAFSARGLQVSTHSIGDAAIRLSLDAYEEGVRAAGNPDVRNKIEHAEDIATDDIARFGRLGVIGSFQPLHANPDPAWIGSWIRNVGPEREQRAFAWKAVLDGGGRLAFGSDWPVVTVSPWPGLQVAVTRQDLDGRPEGGWLPRHKVTLPEAIHAYTMGGAYAMHREKEEGSIETGKLADLIMVSQNIFEVDPREIAKTEVVLTMVGGKVVHDARVLPADRGAGTRPAHTYSIVGVDRETGEMGAAVQSHWFSVGSSVIWAEAGVGAVCTQSFIEPSYGPLGLELMRAGKTSEEALAGLLRTDQSEAVRQVAMLDGRGQVAAHTGKNCIPEAGHFVGDGFTCQANLMLKNTVWDAMAKAFTGTRGELADRLLAALEAAEGEGGDIRGRQSAAILVVKGKSSGAPWKDRVYDLRVEDHPAPLVELKRLIRLNKAYNFMNRGDELLTGNKVEEAMTSYTRAMDMYPDNAEMVFWPAVTLASMGKVDESLPLFKKVFAIDGNWAVLVPRLPAVGQLPKDKALIEKILAQSPQKR